jgi:hypothetical protein
VAEAQSSERQALPRHAYPLCVKAFAIVIGGLVSFSITLLPRYLDATRNLHAGELAYQRGDYEVAAGFYLRVVSTVPSSKAARIGAAEAIFSEHDRARDEDALSLLQDVDLDQDEWQRIQNVMPQEYRQYFKDQPQ